MSASGSEPSFEWVDTDDQFAEVVDAVATADLYAVDTEFHRERTYFPRVALLQLAFEDRIVLVDPLAVSLAPLAKVLDGPGIAIMHAAAQDLEVLELACDTVPTTLFDTQIAAGFLGYSTPSLTTLTESLLGVRLPKGDRLTDWLRRPLDDNQKRYAASDVAHLHELHALIEASLTTDGRLAWAFDECEDLRTRTRAFRDPDAAWLRIKEARHLRGASAGVARSVAAWRERRAAELDQPVRFILSDLGVVGIAQKMPAKAEQLRGIRGLDERQVKGSAVDALLAAVAEGREHPARRPASDAADLERQLRPAVSLVSAWLSQLGREQRIDTTLLGTRSDIEALLAGVDGARLAEGWRAELVGEPIRRLVDGDAALAFDGGGGLVLEERSGRRIR